MTDDWGPYHDITLTREGLHVQIADNIQELIAAQELQPGDRLPPDRQLAEMLNVSRPTVREALRLLQQRGLIDVKPGSGTYVKTMGPGPVIQTIGRFFSVRDCSFEDMMQVRDLLEPGTAASAAVHATPESIEVLRQRVDALEQAFQSGDPKQLALADSRFHIEIANASGNQLLTALSASIAHLVRKWTEKVSATVLAEEVNKSHRVILQAIVDGDPDRAREACVAHNRMARDVLLR